MTKKPMAYTPGAVRTRLMQDHDFMNLLHGGTISCREVPDPLTIPHVTIAAVGHTGADPMARRVIVQVTPWVPGQDVTGLDEDPDVTAWNIATAAAQILHRTKPVVVDDENAFVGRWVDGPIQLYDKSRGADRVLYYAPIRVETHIRTRSKFGI